MLKLSEDKTELLIISRGATLQDASVTIGGSMVQPLKQSGCRI